MFPKKKTNNIMVFDVETNGLLPKDKIGATKQTIHLFPYILQLSYTIYNIEKQKCIKTFDAYINIPKRIEISNQITELTGITREKCDKGMNILSALRAFHSDFIMCDEIIAHNMRFDKQMILVELTRNFDSIQASMPSIFTTFNSKYMERYEVETYCTMMNGIHMCNIQVEGKEGKTYKKWPKLNELYSHLFKAPAPDNLHNSLVDTVVCLRCYLKMKANIDMRDRSFTKLLSLMK